MHVLITADTLGGVWTYARELVTELVRRGVRVTLVSFGEIPSLESTRWMESLDRVDFRPTGFKLEWMQESEDDLAAAAEYLRMVINEGRPDLLHFNQFYYGGLESRLPKVVVAHSDVISWWHAVHKKAPPQSAWMKHYHRVVSHGLAGADIVIAPSFTALRELASNFAPLRCSKVIYDGRNPVLFSPHKSKEPYAVSVGRVWDLGKNAALLARIETPWPIYLAGDNQGPGRSAPPNAPGLDDRSIVFKGVLMESQLRALYAGASIYIATSQYEPFGLAPLEAALSRCAILASDIPSLREIWQDAAVYFRNNDPASLQAELLDLCADPRRIREYGNRALQHARARYPARRMADAYLDLYRTLVREEVMAA